MSKPTILVLDGRDRFTKATQALIRRSPFVVVRHPTKRHLFEAIKSGAVQIPHRSTTWEYLTPYINQHLNAT